MHWPHLLPIESDQHANGDLDTQVGRKRRALRHWRAHELRVWLNQKEMVGMSSDHSKKIDLRGGIPDRTRQWGWGADPSEEAQAQWQTHDRAQDTKTEESVRDELQWR
jgi:hypothetical protein